jgi:hypothetical protein
MAQMLIFTDGEDNCSTQYTLPKIIELIKEKFKWNRHCTFIQAGPACHVVTALKQGCSAKHCSTISVEDSANGIRMVIKVLLCITFGF